MKKFKLASLLFFLILGTLSGQEQSQKQIQAKNILGVSWGIIPGIMDMYIDMPMNSWPEQEIGYIAQVFYARQLAESFRIGSFLEYEKTDYENECFARYTLGINWLGNWPRSAFHLQLGGYFSYGIVTAPNWDRLSGGELGAIAGPAYDRNKFGVAFHVQGGHGWYESSGTPEGLMLYSPKFLLKAYYKF